LDVTYNLIHFDGRKLLRQNQAWKKDIDIDVLTFGPYIPPTLM